MINGSQHLHHELRVQQHAVARFPPKLLLLPGETTHTQPEEGTHIHSRISKVSKVIQHQATNKGRWFRRENKTKVQRRSTVPSSLYVSAAGSSTDQMRRTTKGNISQFLSELHKEETHQTVSKGGEILLL